MQRYQLTADIYVRRHLKEVTEANLTRNMPNDPDEEGQLSGADLNYFFQTKADSTKNSVSLCDSGL